MQEYMYMYGIYKCTCTCTVVIKLHVCSHLYVQVASYDFISPILINGQDPISPPPEQWPPSKRDPQTSVGRPRTSISSVYTHCISCELAI